MAGAVGFKPHELLSLRGKGGGNPHRDTWIFLAPPRAVLALWSLGRVRGGWAQMGQGAAAGSHGSGVASPVAMEQVLTLAGHMCGLELRAF